jgi:murein DD-endopeptidase MepM/ murein hydrolase activator NlpD
VIETESGTNHVYMHLQDPSPIPEGDPVAAGQQIGAVGATGDAQGCHLHIEFWTAPGWYEGGTPVDPAPLLRRLDAGGGRS